MSTLTCLSWAGSLQGWRWGLRILDPTTSLETLLLFHILSKRRPCRDLRVARRQGVLDKESALCWSSPHSQASAFPVKCMWIPELLSVLTVILQTSI